MNKWSLYLKWLLLVTEYVKKYFPNTDNETIQGTLNRILTKKCKNANKKPKEVEQQKETSSQSEPQTINNNDL